MSRVITTRRTLLARLSARIELAWCRYRLRCLIDEREAYMQARVPMGPRYRENCDRQARDLRARIALLECLT